MENNENKSGEKTPEQKKDKKPVSKLLPKTPKFSYYWIYAVIAVLLLAFQFFSFRSNVETIDFNRFKSEMLKGHDVERLVLVNNEVVEVFIKEDKLKNDKYKDVKDNAWGGVNKGPHYQFKVISPSYFAEEMDKLQAGSKPDEVV